MTQVFDDAGNVYPATLLRVSPLTVVQIKESDGPDGYSAVQVGIGEQKEKRMSKALLGHLKDGRFKDIRQFRIDSDEVKNFERGNVIDVSVFEAGDKVRVSGVSKGKGFQGVVKRHGFAGGPRTHGQKHSERSPGSIGAGGVQRVFKGVRMAGRMGQDRITIKNLKVLKVDKEAGELYISGALPGRKGTLLEIKEA